MCGIAGLYRHQNTSDRQAVTRALARLNHRGPDGEGLYDTQAPHGGLALGHKRLSIIDLSDAGLQPRHSDDGRYTITYNGEIYNYVELREELTQKQHHFTTQTDTEVLLKAWQEWGVACLERLDGMFAFAIYDRKTNRLSCARDPFGIKPLFYCASNDAIAFSSELPALLEMLPVSPKLNVNRAYMFMQWGNLEDTPDTFYQGVHHLPAGHLCHFDLGSSDLPEPQIERWWYPPIRERTDLSFEDAAEELRHLFLQSVKRQLRSDVDWGAALSGGVDSSAIVCAIRHLEPDIPIKTFSYIAPEERVSEKKWCEIVEKAVGAIPHYAAYDPGELSADLDDLIASHGEPTGGPSAIAQYYVFRHARRSGVTVTLDGQGADELMAGYAGYPSEAFQSYIDRKEFGALFSFMNAWSEWPGRSKKQAFMHLGDAVVPENLRAFMLRIAGYNIQPDWIKPQAFFREGGEFAPQYRLPQSDEGHGRRLSERLRNALQFSRLPHFLRNGDRNSMRWSIESRVPFLSPELAKFALSMPERFHLSDQGETKHLFRKAMRGIVPDVILDRKDKIGFAAPEKEILLQDRGRIDGWLQVASDIDFLDQDAMRKSIDDMLDGRTRFTTKAWRLIMFCRWAELQTRDMKWVA